MRERIFYEWLLFASLAVAVGVFFVLLFVTAPYGRHARPGWGPTINATIGWMLMETPAPLGMAVLFLLSDRRTSLLPILFFFLWELHYVHRAYIFPLRRRTKDRRAPLLIVLFAFVFNCTNAYLIGRWLFFFGPERGPLWLADPRFVLGLILFLGGFFVNIHADETLWRLRRRTPSGYGVPEGGLFRFVSCPNYLGEIGEWCGFALLTFSFPALVFALWTIANLAPRALAHHAWYKRTFLDYPAKRKALIPFVL